MKNDTIKNLIVKCIRENKYSDYQIANNTLGMEVSKCMEYIDDLNDRIDSIRRLYDNVMSMEDPKQPFAHDRVEFSHKKLHKYTKIITDELYSLYSVAKRGTQYTGEKL